MASDLHVKQGHARQVVIFGLLRALTACCSVFLYTELVSFALQRDLLMYGQR